MNKKQPARAEKPDEKERPDSQPTRPDRADAPGKPDPTPTGRDRIRHKLDVNDLQRERGKVRQGARLPLTFGRFNGVGGVAEIKGEIEVAFPLSIRAAREIREGSIEDQAVRVVSVREGDAIGQVVLRCVPIDETN